MDCQEKFDNDKYEFLSLPDETIDWDEIIPISFHHHFYAYKFAIITNGLAIARDITLYLHKKFN